MISVLLAAYCGENYIAEQIASILPQLRWRDELLVSDDSPEGHTATREAVLAFADERIRYMQGPRQGVIKNVEYLLTQARGDILVLCDQDDVWLPDKLKCTRSTLVQCGPALLIHDAKLTDENLRVTEESLFRLRGAKQGFWRNLLKNGYTGCCMAFTRELLPHILPFPEGIPMHDQWIGLQAERLGRVEWMEGPTYILHRRHGGAQTGGGSTLRQKIAWRRRLLRALLLRWEKQESKHGEK